MSAPITSTTNFILAIENHFEQNGIKLNKSTMLEIECKHSCRMNFVRESFSWLSIPCTSFHDEKKIQVSLKDLHSFLEVSQENSEVASSRLTLPSKKTKEIIKKSFSPLEIAKHNEKFYKGQIEKVKSILFDVENQGIDISLK